MTNAPRPLPPRLVVVPMKDPARAKTRLGGTLSAARRATLAQILFSLTLQRLERIRRTAQHGFDIATVTSSPLIASHARAAGIRVIDEGPAQDLNAAIADAADWAHRAGYAAMAVLPGDLAQPLPADLLTLLDRPAYPAQAVICESSDGGTNALLLPLPVPIAFHYGPDSFRAHLAAAQRAGLDVLTPQLDSLRHDIDRGEDLAHLAPHTQRCIDAGARP